MACSNFTKKDISSLSDTQLAEFDSLLRRGIDQTSKLQPDSAQRTLTKLLLKAQKFDAPRYELLAYNNLGRLFQRTHLEDLATNSYLKAVDIAKSRALPQYLNTLYNNLGLIYQQNKSYHQSLDYLKMALHQSRQQNDTMRIGLNLINMGVSLAALGEDTDAVKAYKEAIKYFIILNDSINLSPGYTALGNHFYDLQRYDSALSYFSQAIRYAPKLAYPWFHWVGDLNMGKTLLKLGYLDEAEIHLKNANRNFRQSNDLAMLIEAKRALKNLETERGNYRATMNYADSLILLQDSLLVKKSSKWASELQMNYAFALKVKELDTLQTDSRRRQWMMMGGIALAVLIGGFIFFGFRNANKLLKQRNIILKKEQEVNTLKLKNKANEQRVMQVQLEYKNRELAGKAIHLISRDEAFNQLRKTLTDGIKESAADRLNRIKDALSIIKAGENMEDEWHSFIVHFETVHPDFFRKLKKVNHRLTSNDLRICAYLTMDFSAKEIARIYNITPESVRKRKQRLREKLGLSSEVDIEMWLNQQRVAN